MEMIEIAKAITNYGVLIIITSIAIWFVVYNYLQTEKRTKIEEEKREKERLESKMRDDKFNESLQMLSRSIDNQTRTLDLLQKSQVSNEISLKKHDENIVSMLTKHDERAISIKEEIISLRTAKKAK